MRLNVVACSIIRPWAAPLMTTSSAVGIISASSSLSPRGVRMSWLPTTTSVGTSIVGSSPASESSAARIADDLGGEGLAGATEAERAEPADHRHEAAERPWPDHPAGGVPGHRPDAVALRVRRPRLEQLLAPRLVAARRAHERQRAHAVGPQHGDELGDGAAHRGADDVGALDADVVEHGDGVGCHLVEVVVADRLVAAPGAAVVEGDDAVAQREHEALDVPAVLVHAEALDHQQRRCRGPSGHAVVDATAVGAAHVRHVRRLPTPSSSVRRSSSLDVLRRSRRRRAGRAAAAAGSPGRSRCAPTARCPTAPPPPGRPGPCARRRVPNSVRIAATDPPRVERAAEPDDEHLAVAQRPGDLVGPLEQTAEATGQGTERGEVRAPDEADRPARSRRSASARPTTA